MFPTDFASSTLDIATTVFASFNTYTELVVGVLLAVTVLAIIIGVLNARK